MVTELAMLLILAYFFSSRFTYKLTCLLCLLFLYFLDFHHYIPAKFARSAIIIARTLMLFSLLNSSRM